MAFQAVAINAFNASTEVHAKMIEKLVWALETIANTSYDDVGFHLVSTAKKALKEYRDLK